MRIKNAILLGVLLIAGVPVLAQESTTPPGSSSESSYYRRGFGFKDANVFDPKYKERLKNWREQMDLGLQRGFLKPADADRFRPALERLTSLEADLAAKKYPKPETDAMEQEFNAFNVQFTQAMQPTTPPPPAVPAVPAVPATTPPTPPIAPPAVAPAKPVAKPAAAPAKKAVVTKKAMKHKTKKGR